MSLDSVFSVIAPTVFLSAFLGGNGFTILFVLLKKEVNIMGFEIGFFENNFKQCKLNVFGYLFSTRKSETNFIGKLRFFAKYCLIFLALSWASAFLVVFIYPILYFLSTSTKPFDKNDVYVLLVWVGVMFLPVTSFAVVCIYKVRKLAKGISLDAQKTEPASQICGLGRGEKNGM